jgi:hypothetical protein
MISQPDLFDDWKPIPPSVEPRPFARKRIAYKATSREALRAFAPVTGDLDNAIIKAIRLAGAKGISDEGIEQLTGRKHQAVSGNRRHLVERGVIRDSGNRGKTRSGRACILWVLA